MRTSQLHPAKTKTDFAVMVQPLQSLVVGWEPAKRKHCRVFSGAQHVAPQRGPWLGVRQALLAHQWHPGAKRLPVQSFAEQRLETGSSWALLPSAGLVNGCEMLTLSQLLHLSQERCASSGE